MKCSSPFLFSISISFRGEQYIGKFLSLSLLPRKRVYEVRGEREILEIKNVQNILGHAITLKGLNVRILYATSINFTVLVGAAYLYLGVGIAA